MLLKFIFLCLLFIVIGGSFILYRQPEFGSRISSYTRYIPGLKEVKGLNTERAGSISGQLRSEFDKGVDDARKQALNLKVSDLMNYLNRGQKIASDLRGFQEYIKKEVENFRLQK